MQTARPWQMQILFASTHVPESVRECCLVLPLTQVKNIYWSTGADSTSESTAPGEGYSISGISTSVNLKVLALVLVRLFLLFMPHKPQSIRVSRYCASCVRKIYFCLTRNSPIMPLMHKLKYSTHYLKILLEIIITVYTAVGWCGIVITAPANQQTVGTCRISGPHDWEAYLNNTWRALSFVKHTEMKV